MTTKISTMNRYQVIEALHAENQRPMTPSSIARSRALIRRQHIIDLDGETARRCCDCRNGEHENYDDDVRLVVIRDSETNRLQRRGYICQAHREMYNDDGFDTIET